MVISASLQTCGVVFPFAMPTSICRSNVTICSALYLLFGISSRPPREFSLTSAGTKKPGQVSFWKAIFGSRIAQVVFALAFIGLCVGVRGMTQNPFVAVIIVLGCAVALVALSLMILW